MKLTKAIIPVAGFGTRMLPAAKAVPKELLPILDKPTIQYVLEEALAGGIDEALLITGRDKRAIEDHFDRHSELEQRLAAGGKEALLASVNEISRKIRIHSVRQPQQRGLGDAVNQARHYAGGNAVLCMLGDTVFSGGEPPALQLARAYESLGTAIIGLEEVPLEKVDRYGIVGGHEISDGIIRIETLVEKPPRDQAPSRLAIAARYVLTPGIFACLDATAPGKGGEIQLTDALKLLLLREPIHGVRLKSRRHDIGNPVDWLQTNIIFASHDESLWKQIEPLLRKLLR